MEAKVNKGKLVGGLVCLALAGLLGVLWFVLPEGEVVFMVGDDNVVWVPILVLAGSGVALLGNALQRQRA